MLKVMRDSFHRLKWILIAVVAAFVFGFVFIDMGLGGASRTSGPKDQGFAARVNGETISLRDYNRSLYFAEENYKRMYGNQLTPEMIEQMGLQKQVLESLVDERLLIQQARRLDLYATPEEVRKRILEIPTLNPDGKFVGSELYTRYVTGQLGFQSAAEFEEELGREITLSKMESALQNSIVVSQKSADAEYRRMNETARIRYVSLPAAREIATVAITPAEVEAYYKANQGKYSHGEQRNVKYLIADFARLRSQINPSEADLRAKYETMKDQFRSPEAAHVFHILVKVAPNANPNDDAAAKAKTESIVQQLRGGADFAKLAKQNSDDPSSSAAGGDMGFVDRGLTVESFENAIFSIPLNTVDYVRSPEFGYHIIKVTEKRAGGYKTFEEVRTQLASQVAETTARETAKNEMNRIAAAVKSSKPATAEAFAGLATPNVSSNDTQWFQKGDSIPGLGYNPPLATWVFTAKAGEVGEVIGTQRGIIIPYLVGIRGAGVAPLAEVRARVETDARTAKARELVKNALATAMAGAATVDAVAAKTGAGAADTTVSRQGFTGGFQGDTTELVNQAMAAKVGDVKGPIVVGDTAVAFQILEQKRVEDKDLEQNRLSYAQALRQQQARSLRKVLIERLRGESKVEMNEAAVTNGGQAGI
jgi:peptidyl-prolyl cis-trans isomerase D